VVRRGKPAIIRVAPHAMLETLLGLLLDSPNELCSWYSLIPTFEKTPACDGDGERLQFGMSPVVATILDQRHDIHLP